MSLLSAEEQLMPGREINASVAGCVLQPLIPAGRSQVPFTKPRIDPYTRGKPCAHSRYWTQTVRLSTYLCTLTDGLRGNTRP